MFGIMNNTHNIDVSGYNCPIPVLKIKKVIKTLKKGERLKIIATDPMIKIDLPTFCRESNCKLIYIKDTEESIFCEIQVLYCYLRMLTINKDTKINIPPTY